MAKEKRVVLDSFPAGSIDREELRRKFVEAGERDRARTNKPSSGQGNDSRSNAANPDHPRVIRKDGQKVKRVADNAKR